MEPVYQYRATLDRVVDGDTYILQTDLGFNVFNKLRVRLHKYDTPEIGEPNHDEAKLEALLQLTNAKQIIVVSYHDQMSYQRWIADVYVDGDLLGERLKAKGLLKPPKAP